MPRVRPLLAVSIGFTIMAAATVAFAADVTATGRMVAWLSLDRDGAVVGTVIAALCWLEMRRDALRGRRDGGGTPLHDECRRREAVLALTINSLVDERAEQPVQRLRSV